MCWNSNESVVRLNRHSHAAAFLPASRSKKHCDASFAACILGGNEAMEPGKRNVSTIVNGNLLICIFLQRTKKVVSDSPGLVDFAIGLVNSAVNLPDGQVRFFEQFE